MNREEWRQLFRKVKTVRVVEPVVMINSHVYASVLGYTEIVQSLKKSRIAS
jgi:hypothetical protein